MGGAGAAPSGATQTVVFDEGKIKAGLGKAFCSVTEGTARLINYALSNSVYEVEFTPVMPEEGDLWAEFAFPVLKMYLPNFEQNPVTVLCVMTGLILSGKIRIKKTEVTTNVERQSGSGEQSTGPAGA